MSQFEIVILALMGLVMFGKFFVPGNRFSGRIVSRIVIPFLLLFLWLVSLIYQSFIIENVFTIITTSYSKSQLTSYPASEILSGQKITGKFIADQNHLGILGFRFWTFYRLNDDYLIFRIKPQGSPDWYYQNVYKTDQFQPNQYFTFGFPEINNSKGKTYQFEIESTLGTPGDAVGLSTSDPVYIVKYKFPKSRVIRNTSSFLSFILLKLENLTSSPNFKASSFVFFLPLFVYVIFISGLQNTRRNKILVSVSLSLLGLIADIFFIKDSPLSLIFIVSVFLYVFTTYHLRTGYLFLIGLLSLSISCFLLYFGSGLSSERAGAWAWIFISFWFINQIWRIRKQP